MSPFSAPSALLCHVLIPQQMNPLVFIYTRLISLTVFGLRVLFLMAVCASVLGIFHLSGLWDLQYQHSRQVASPPLDRFVAMATHNPLVHLETALLQKRSFWAASLRLARQPAASPGLRPPAADSWHVLWQWLSSQTLLAHNPYPQLRRARLQASWQLEQLLLYYYSNFQVSTTSYPQC